MNTYAFQTTVRRQGGFFVPERLLDVNNLSSKANGGINSALSAKITLFMETFSKAARLGYSFDDEAVAVLSQADEGTLKELLAALRRIKGDTEYKAFRENFDVVVPSMSDAQIYTEQVLHYVGSFYLGIPRLENLVKRDVEIIRKSLDGTKTTVLKVLHLDEVKDAFKGLVSQNQPFSEADRFDVESYVNLLSGEASMEKILDEVKVPIRENLVYLAGLDEAFTAEFTHLTDVLRYATMVSGGDWSLTESTKFKLSRSRRRAIVSMMDRILGESGEDHEELASHREMWKRLIGYLHAGDYGVARVNRAIDVVYNGTARSFESILEEKIKDKDLNGVVDLLSERPGVYARSILRLARVFGGTIDEELHSNADLLVLMEGFSRVASKVDKRILVQLWQKAVNERQLSIDKYGYSRISSSEDAPAIKRSVQGVVEDVLKDTMKGQRVFVDGSDKVVIPTSNRSASDGATLIGRGSRISIGDSDVVRLFAWWMDQKDGYRIDLDLHSYFYDEYFRQLGHVGYWNQKENYCYMSGDLTSGPRPDGAAEFLDIHVDKALEAGHRYVVVALTYYNGRDLSTLDDAWTGFMFRDSLGHKQAGTKGEVFEPSTVEVKYDLSAKGRTSLLAVLDLENREYVFVDAPSVDLNGYSDSPEVEVLVKSEYMTVGKWLELTGATVVTDEKDADVVIRTDDTASVLSLIGG